MEPLVLTFDIGTQSIRAVLAEKNGSFLGSLKHTYEEPFLTEQPFFVEQRPGFFYEELCGISKRLLSEYPEALPRVRCVTVTTIRDTVLCLDKDCRPLGNFILWLDMREAQYDPSALPLPYRLLFRVAGKLDTIEFQQRCSTCNWIMQKDPERWKNTAHYVYLSTYINYLMTGNLQDSSGSVIGHMPFDYKKRRWLGKRGLTYGVYPIPEDKLFPTLEPGEILGNITPECSLQTGIPAGLPLLATGSDKGCETVGLSVLKPGAAAISFGTSSTIQITTKGFVEPQPLMPAYPAAFPGHYNPEIQIYRGYWMLTWFIDEFCQEEKRQAALQGIHVEKLLDRKLSQVPEGSGGLLIQPYWSPGVATPSARGCMVGFSDRQSKYHVYRAIIEGINFELMCAQKMLERQSGTPIRELFIGGGGASSPEILQITADMFGLPVHRIQTHEATALGSSLIAFTVLREFRSMEEAASSMVHISKTYLPDEKKHRFYTLLFREYEKLYGNLKRTYRKEKEIFGREEK